MKDFYLDTAYSFSVYAKEEKAHGVTPDHVLVAHPILHHSPALDAIFAVLNKHDQHQIRRVYT